MSEMLTVAQSGTLESNDIMITLAPNSIGSGITLDLESVVLAQYGEILRQVILDTVTSQGVTDVAIKAVDRGALDCTVRARVLVALERAGVKIRSLAEQTSN